MTPKPEDAAKIAIKLLNEKRDPFKAEQAQKYFKEPVKVWGLTSPQVREIGREIYQKIKNEWTVDEAIALCDILLPHPYHEPKGLAVLILERYKKEFPKSLFTKIHRWLVSDYLNSWAAVDILCPNCVGTLLEIYPDLLGKIETWTQSPNRWIRRASLVSFIKLARKEKYREFIYRQASRLFVDRDDLIQKANGWLLRETGKGDMKRLERFLLEKGSAIPRTTLRYAIERFDEKKRKALLLATK